MRSTFLRFAVLCAGIAAVVSCDAGPTVTRFGNGISGGPDGTGVTPVNLGPDTTTPFLRFIVPVDTPEQLVNVGDSLLVSVRMNDDRALGWVRMTGWKEVGDPAFGTYQRIMRYGTVQMPATGSFRSALVDTTVGRFLKPVTPVDSTVGRVLIEVIGADSAGNVDTLYRYVSIVEGPRVTVLSPVNNDSVPRGTPFSVQVQATHQSGVDSVVIRAQSEPGWPTPLDTTIRQTFPAGSRDVTMSAAVALPPDAPARGRITITARARDVNRNPGSAVPVVVFVRALASLAPRVYQTVPPVMEMSDSVMISAAGDGIASIGRIILDENGAVISRDSVVFTAPLTSTRTVGLPLNLTIADQGRRLKIISYAWDGLVPPAIGYSIPAGTDVPVSLQANAVRDSLLVAYGRTYVPPRPGVMGDIAVDTRVGLANVFISNTAHNILEVWNNVTKAFDASGVAVGAQPWGLAVSVTGANADTLLVANSGATTISRVSMSAKREDLTRRIRTRNNVIFQVAFTRDANTGLIRLTSFPPISYSDRPQYLAQSEGGRIYYSTRPTAAATPGTIRWMDPTQPIPDARQITSYIEKDQGDAIIYTIFDADSVKINPRAALGLSDELIVYDHPDGQSGPTVSSSSIDPPTAVDGLATDTYWLLNVSVPSLALTDTTFVASSGDRKWIGFGEGNTPLGRLMMINDPLGGPLPPFFSPAMAVDDIIHNASETVFGLAIDPTGQQVLAHGLKTYVAALETNFHLRLDGEYDSFDNGAGVAFHPQANDGDPDHRVAFTATSGGVIEIFDIAHYNNRGRLTTKGNLYGALRVTGPIDGDPAEVVAKIYGLTDRGLVVIDVRAADIKPAP